MSDFWRGLAPQPRLIWGVAIGAGLIALAVASPLFGFIAIVYNAGLVIIAARDLALLPGRSGYSVRRSMPEPFSLGEPEEVTVVIQNRSAAGLMSTVADHAPGAAPTPSVRSTCRSGAKTGGGGARSGCLTRRRSRFFPTWWRSNASSCLCGAGCAQWPACGALGLPAHPPRSPACASTSVVTMCGGSAGRRPQGATARWWSRSRRSEDSR